MNSFQLGVVLSDDFAGYCACTGGGKEVVLFEEGLDFVVVVGLSD